MRMSTASCRCSEVDAGHEHDQRPGGARGGRRRSRPEPTRPFGGITATNGDTIDIAALGANEIVINAKTADKVDAKVGDTIVAYYNNQPVQMTVAAIAKDTVLSGSLNTGMPGMVTSLARLQEITGLPNTYSLIAISNKGGVRDGKAHTDAVVTQLETALAGTKLGVDPIKKDTVDEVESFSALFTSLFLVLGLFSIAAGILLIVLIFTMLAAERRSEMGMARAVGTHRRQLIQQFVAEGSGYALLSGLVGSALGVAAAYGIGYAIQALVGDDLSITPHVEPRSLMVAYCLGVVITFLAVVGSSWKISRLNVVAAIRDIPDVQASKRSWKVLLWGTLMLLGGGLLTMSGQARTRHSLLCRHEPVAVRSRACSAASSGPVPAGLQRGRRRAVFLWLLPESVGNKLSGELDGGFEMFFLSGIFMVIGATVLIVQNTDVLLRGCRSWVGCSRKTAGGADRGRLSGRGTGPDRHDDRDVQPDRLLAGHDGDDE